jgi:hypothetical protein
MLPPVSAITADRREGRPRAVENRTYGARDRRTVAGGNIPPVSAITADRREGRLRARGKAHSPDALALPTG